MPLFLPRNAQLWLPSLLSSRLRRALVPRHVDGPTDIFFCIADHFEPDHGAADASVERARVATWVERYPRLAEQFADSDGRPSAAHVLLPEEGYRPELLDSLADLCRRGFGDVEVHLHHDRDTRRCTARSPGPLHRDAVPPTRAASPPTGTARITFGFIHGNWALDNARPDGRWCGVNNEITVLLEAGCYADFTLPAAPDASQTRTINSIYYAIDDPARPRSHDFGIPARVGHTGPARTPC